MSVHAQSLSHVWLHDHTRLVSDATRDATWLLAIASTVALGAVGVELAVVGIAVLTPLVLLGALALSWAD
ncbi:MAG: hypothetical protein QM704_02855 [Anaeromyxobacteraceae bacterium]